ncbi:nose resistant to fluoxetine protein 6-like [Mya arenaria]|uniref:nose resistant to fluoxetine protein 6-like n=1 Tax=Mya arenaria TaxID=6604 RepID=UPI0022E441BD|nr:nose resistant to fluoxetine protein 6-like [Mya arenaria]
MFSQVVTLIVLITLPYSDGLSSLDGNNNMLASAAQALLPALGNTLGIDNLDSVVDFFNQNGSLSANGLNLLTPLAGQLALQSWGLSRACSQDLMLLVEDLRSAEPWALQVLDAFGKPDSGIMKGRIWFPGGFDECLDLHADAYNNATDNMQTLNGKYCRLEIDAGLPQTSALKPRIRIGVCMPSNCVAKDLNLLMENIQMLLFNDTIRYDVTPLCSENKPLASDAIAVIIILSVLVAFILFGTLYDIIAVQMKGNEQLIENKQNEHEGCNGAVNGVGIKGYANGAYQPTTEGSEHDKKNSVIEVEAGQSKPVMEITEVATEKKPKLESRILEKICLAFSAYSNGVKILSTVQGAGSLGALNGIRFLSMAWVILGHTYFFASGVDANLGMYFYDELQNPSFSAVVYASVSVDSFFTLSGVLVAYLTLRELKKVDGVKGLNWFMFYFHRFWRLTPPYMLVIMVGTVLLPYIVSGPFWNGGEFPNMGGCRKYWWTNLIYVNNYVIDDETCMGWSWYLANDMQFYIISPLILLPLFYNVFAGAACGVVFIAASTAAIWVVDVNHEYSAQAALPFAPPPKDANFTKNLYVPSYTRIGPYVLGLFAGYLLYKTSCKLRIPKAINILGWFLSFSLICTVIYSPYTDGQSHMLSIKESAAYFSFHRTGWGLAMSWIIVSCCTGHGGWINELLSWSGFIPLSRLTYCAYLIHPLIMTTFYMCRRELTYFTQFELIYLFLGHMTMTYGLSFIVSLVFEAPMMGLEKAVFRKGGK